MDLMYFILSMLLYAVIPIIPAILLRVKLQMLGTRIIAVIATLLGITCLAVIMAGGEALIEDYEGLATFAQCALTSSVPVLFCVAFAGYKGEIWLTLVPSVLYFAGFTIRFFVVFGVAETLNFFAKGFDMIFQVGVTGGEEAMTITLMSIMSIVFFAWALVCVIITKTIYKYIEKRKNEKMLKNKNMRRR